MSQSSPITHLASARSTTTPSASSCSNPTPCRPWCASSGRQPTVVDPSRFPRHRSRHCAVVREGHMRWPQSGRSGDSSADRNRASSGLMPPSPPGSAHTPPEHTGWPGMRPRAAAGNPPPRALNLSREPLRGPLVPLRPADATKREQELDIVVQFALIFMGLEWKGHRDPPVGTPSRGECIAQPEQAASLLRHSALHVGDLLVAAIEDCGLDILDKHDSRFWSRCSGYIAGFARNAISLMLQL